MLLPYHTGNMRTQEVGSESAPTTIIYTHDLWNRLVKVEYQPFEDDPVTRAVYRYNALNWRIEKVADVGPGGVPDGTLDQKRSMYYSANWQLLHESIDDNLDSSDDRRMQYLWGPRYIDDLVMRRLDADANGSFADAGDKAYYHCTDSMFSTVAILDDAAKVIERVSYDPYGRARHHRKTDCALGDGAVNTNDQLLVLAQWSAVSPSPGDVNRDGSVNTNDLLAVIGDWGSGLAPGRLSSTDNIIGWDGYVFDAEIGDGGKYKVRHRDLDVDLGRWMETDPLTHIEGMSMYQYGAGAPVLLIDPFGLLSKHGIVWHHRIPVEIFEKYEGLCTLEGVPEMNCADNGLWLAEKDHYLLHGENKYNNFWKKRLNELIRQKGGKPLTAEDIRTVMAEAEKEFQSVLSRGVKATTRWRCACDEVKALAAKEVQKARDKVLREFGKEALKKGLEKGAGKAIRRGVVTVGTMVLTVGTGGTVGAIILAYDVCDTTVFIVTTTEEWLSAIADESERKNLERILRTQEIIESANDSDFNGALGDLLEQEGCGLTAGSLNHKRCKSE